MNEGSPFVKKGTRDLLLRVSALLPWKHTEVLISPCLDSKSARYILSLLPHNTVLRGIISWHAALVM